MFPRTDSPAAPSRPAALVRFTRLRLQIHALATAAAALPLADHYAAQARTLSSIAGLRLHRAFGDPTPTDALALRDDLEALWRAIDPLVAAIGAEAAHALPVTIDLTLFTDALRGVLEGNATYELTMAAERIAVGEHRGIAAE